MSDQAALLRAILDQPDEAVHRLVYADWLEEHGDEARAEFIRAQCRMARFYDPDDPFRAGMVEGILRPEYRQAWLAPLHALGLGPNEEAEYRFAFTFRRGFVESIYVSGPEAVDSLIRQAGAVCSLTPFLHLRLGADNGGNWEPLTVVLLERLVSCREVAGLRTLDLRHHYLRDEGANALLASPHLSGNTRVFFEGNSLTAEARLALEARFGSAISCGPDLGLNEDDIPF